MFLGFVLLIIFLKREGFTRLISKNIKIISKPGSASESVKQRFSSPRLE